MNGREQIMCEYKPCDGDLVEPIRNARVVRDLIVDTSSIERFNCAGMDGANHPKR